MRRCYTTMTRMIDRDPLLRDDDDDDRAWREAQERRQAEGDAKQAPTPTGKGDLALRLALMKAGVITEAQIDEAEKLIDKARDQGKVLMLEEDMQGVMQWRLLSMEELRRALGSAVVSS